MIFPIHNATHRPKVSIILPSFNREMYIANTIESCLNQTLTNFELIIIDDCSQDNSVKIIKKYADSDNRIKFIQNETNKRLPTNLNIGFSQGNGEYFTWISDDNLFHPTALEKMSFILDQKSDIGLVYADYLTINNCGDIKHRLYQEDPEYLPIRDCVGPCFLYRSSIAREIGGYDSTIPLVEDYEYWLRIGLISKLYHLKEAIYYYRTHSESLTKTKKIEMKKAQNLLKQKFANDFILDDKLKPINDLYLCFIAPQSFKNYLKFISIIIRNPLITLPYIFKQLKRMYYILDI